jgi:hypothetical protein
MNAAGTVTLHRHFKLIIPLDLEEFCRQHTKDLKIDPESVLLYAMPAFTKP